MEILVKNMVSLRCKKLVESALEILNIEFKSIELGIVVTKKNISSIKLDDLNSMIKTYGLEIIFDKTTIVIEKIKGLIIKRITNFCEADDNSFAKYLSFNLKYDYHYLSKVFSESEGINLHRFIILQKIEKVKELLLLKEMNISEIAFKLNYSSLAHLSIQFKKITGITPSAFKTNGVYNRICVEEIGQLV